jgi:pimeloyl-ACP methyl ester carboxylesterase
MEPRLVVALATCAFEAYSDPDPRQIIRECGSDTTVTYLTRDHIRVFPSTPQTKRTLYELVSNYRGVLKAMYTWAWGQLFASRDWRSLSIDAGMYRFWQPIAVLSNIKLDTQAWIYLDRAEREVVIAFRGTEGLKLLDVLTNLNLRHAPLGFWEQRREADRGDDEAYDNNKNKEVAYRLVSKHGSEARAHAGFVAAYESVRSHIMTLVDREEPTRVYVTGHSMGGALATVCALDLATRDVGRTTRSYDEVVMCSFGAPRVGNSAFAAIFNAAVNVSVRWNTDRDIVPTLPAETMFDQRFTHVKNDLDDEDEDEDEDEEVVDEWERRKSDARKHDRGYHRRFGAIEMVFDIIIHSISGKLVDHLPWSYLASLRRVVWPR